MTTHAWNYGDTSFAWRQFGNYDPTPKNKWHHVYIYIKEH